MSGNQSVQQRTWVAACSHRLQRQWPSVDPEQVEELATTLWQDRRLRELEPTDAAAEWLQPVLKMQPRDRLHQQAAPVRPLEAGRVLGSAGPGQIEDAAVGQTRDHR